MNTQEIIYNGLTTRQILNRLPLNMIKAHKKEYLENCLFVYKNESKGFNLGYCKLTRDVYIYIYN